MKRAVLAFMAAFWLVPQLAAAATPGRAEFEIVRNGRVEGRHVLDVSRGAGGALNVSGQINIAVRIGPVVVARYEQRCTETWNGAALGALDCSTLKEGRRQRVTARRGDDELVVSGRTGEVEFPLSALPTSWWMKPPAFNGTMINTENGRAEPLRVTYVGRQTLNVGGQNVQADHVRVQGSLTADLWYDAQGRWIGCNFTVRGQRFSYRLVTPLENAPRGVA